MTSGGGRSGEAARASAEEAFAVLGNETRLGILLALGETDGALSFSDLYEAVEYDTTANFSYHLEKLQDHFVRQSGDGYELRPPGRRVVEAVRSGAFTEATGREPSEAPESGVLDVDPLRSGRASETRVDGDRNSCERFWERAEQGDSGDGAGDPGTGPLWAGTLPPAGSHDRSPDEILGAAEIWRLTEVHESARGICPRCSATVEHSVLVCTGHVDDGARCDHCGRTFGAAVQTACTYCNFEEETSFAEYLLADTDVMAFMIDHGVDPVAPAGSHVSALEQEILSKEPFEARFTYSAGGDELVLGVDDELCVVDVTRRGTMESQ